MRTLLFIAVALLCAWALWALCGCATVPGSITLGYEGAQLTYRWQGEVRKLPRNFEK